MDDRFGPPLIDDPLGQRLVLGLDPDMATYACADCGVVTEPGHAPTVKAFLMDEFLRCEPQVFVLFLDPSLAPRATTWLERLGYGAADARDLVGGALELGLLDGDATAPRLGAARCVDCYFGRGTAFRARRRQTGRS